MKNIILIVAVLFFLGCSSQENRNTAQRILEGEGYTEIKWTGYAPFACDEKDTFSDGFTAKNKNNLPIKGTVCSGWMKGVTIRYH
jgi:hypothetical protein